MRLVLETRCGCSRTVHVPGDIGDRPPPRYTAPLTVRPVLVPHDEPVGLAPMPTRDFALESQLPPRWQYEEPAYLYREVEA